MISIMVDFKTFDIMDIMLESDLTDSAMGRCAELA